MDRKELLERVYRRIRAEGLDWSRAEVRTAFETFLEIVEETLVSGETVGLPGLGTFEVREAPPRKAYDFQKKKVIEIPARRKVFFRPSRKLKTLLRG